MCRRRTAAWCLAFLPLLLVCPVSGQDRAPIAHDVPSASKTLLYLDYRVPNKWTVKREVALIDSMAPTHVVLGINSVKVVKDDGAFRLLGAVARDGALTANLRRYAQQLQKNGSVLGLQVWMTADQAFVEEAARETARVAQELGAGLVVPNTEEDWIGRPSGGSPRMTELARQDHAGLSELFMLTLRESGFKGDVWVACLYYLPRAVRPLLRLSDGVITEVLSFRRDNKPQSNLQMMAPGVLQVRGWDYLAPYRGRPGFEIIHQQAAYNQDKYGVSEDVAMRASASASLGGARGHSERGLAWWSFHNVKGSKARRDVIRAYSPRLPRMER